MVDLTTHTLTAGQKLYLVQPESEQVTFRLVLWDSEFLRPLRPVWSSN